ncbi:MAG: hypothetical protein WCP97_09315 [bacterium]
MATHDKKNTPQRDDSWIIKFIMIYAIIQLLIIALLAFALFWFYGLFSQYISSQYFPGSPPPDIPKELRNILPD